MIPKSIRGVPKSDAGAPHFWGLGKRSPLQIALQGFGWQMRMPGKMKFYEDRTEKRSTRGEEFSP